MSGGGSALYWRSSFKAFLIIRKYFALPFRPQHLLFISCVLQVAPAVSYISLSISFSFHAGKNLPLSCSDKRKPSPLEAKEQISSSSRSQSVSWSWTYSLSGAQSPTLYHSILQTSLFITAFAAVLTFPSVQGGRLQYADFIIKWTVPFLFLSWKRDLWQWVASSLQCKTHSLKTNLSKS